MAGLLSSVEESYGSMAGYVASLGVGPGIVERLRCALLA
jgi:hypothetical protein